MRLKLLVLLSLMPLGLMLSSVIAIAGPAVSSSIEESPESTPEPTIESAISQSRDAVRRMMAESSTPGVCIAVSIDDELIWNEGFGFADLEHLVPVTTGTRFGVGSVSKALTMAAACRLVERGLLDLDAPIERYVEGFPNGDRVTIRQIASHLSGWGDIETAGLNVREQFNSADALLDHLRATSADAEPGAKVKHNTGAYTAIAAILEQVTGKPFEAVMLDEVIVPLGLKGTEPDGKSEIIPKRTSFYQFDEDGNIRNATNVDPCAVRAGDGYLMTAADAVQFGSAMLHTQYLRTVTREQIFARQQTTDGRYTRYGLGWRISSNDDGRVLYHQSGSGPGMTSWVVLLPRYDIAVAVLANITDAPLERVVDAVVTAFADATHEAERAERDARETVGVDTGA